jgi:hypothetical protein
MCTVLLPPGDNPIAVNKYIISYHIITYHFIFLHCNYLVLAGRSDQWHYATGWTIRDSNPGNCKRFCTSPKRPDLLFGPPNLYLVDPAVFFSPTAAGLYLYLSLYLVQSFRISGATLLLPLYASWRGKEELCVFSSIVRGSLKFRGWI